MSAMKVLHVVPALFGAGGVFGGAERYVYELAKNMSEAVPTSLLAFGDENSVSQDGRLSIRVLKRTWLLKGERSNPFSLQLLPEVMKARIIHCHQTHILASSFAALVGRVAGCRVFTTDLGGGGWDLSGYFSTDRLYRGHLHLSDYSRQTFNHAGKQWAHVIYGGVDTERFCPGPPATPRYTVLFVGRLMPHKGVSDLIEAIPPDMPLEIIGHRYNEDYTRHLIRLAQGKKVIFRYEFDDSLLADAYARALCIVLPSVYKTPHGPDSAVPELLGQTLLEGMASGRPVICTDVASMPEIVQEEVTGFVVPPNNPAALRVKLQWLRDHPSEADRMGEAGRDVVKRRFTWSQVVTKCLEIYSA